MLRLCCLVLALAFVPSAFANAPAERRCTDDKGFERCAVEAQSKTRGLYGLDDIGTLAAQGSYVRRTMLVDGYGNDILAVSFVREKGSDPYVEIRARLRKGAKEPRRIRLSIALSEWNELLAKGRYFDRDLAPLKLSDGSQAPLNICLHSWVVTVEAADPARLSDNSLPASDLEPEIRTKTQSACDDGLATEFAFQLADMAYDLIPVCQSVDLSFQRNRATALNACLTMSGDRAAAGQALSLVHEMRRAINIYPKDPAQTRLALERIIVSTDPNDRPAPGSDGITRDMRQRLVDELLRGNIYPERFDGVDADHVVIDALQVAQNIDDEAGPAPQRKMRILASREAGAFRIYRIQAPAFSRTP